MVLQQSKGPIPHGVTPDPTSESLSLSFGVSLVRDLRFLLATGRDGADHSAVALGARPLATIFEQALSSDRLTLDGASKISGVEVGGFTAWPIFITYGGSSHRGTYVPLYNHEQMEERLRDFYGAGPSSIRGSINEALRNIGQHGHRHHTVGYGQCCFGPAALLAREISVDSGDGVKHRVLMAVVTDEGPGIAHPERSMLNGVGSSGGDDALGMGIETKASLLYLVKSKQGEWSLFDGLNHANPDKYAGPKTLKPRHIEPHEKVNRRSVIDLPAPPEGCQKIMFFAHPSATADEARGIHASLLSALEPLRR